jgi:hypothetical protein
MQAAAQTTTQTTVAQAFQQRREVLNSKWTVTLQFSGRVIGGIPAVGLDTADPNKDRNILSIWLKQRLPEATDAELAAEVEKTFAEAFKDAEEQSSTTFKADAKGLYIEGRQVKAMLKEAGGRLGLGKAVAGKRPSLKQDLHEAMHVDEDVIHLLRDGAPVTQPDGYDVRPIHVMGPQGPRTSIKRCAYVEGAQVTFTVRVLNVVTLSEEHLLDILAFAQDLGLGADRSQGNGKFAVVGFERIG